MTNATVTMEDKFNAAKKEIRKAGIRVRFNVYGCCGGCIGETELGMKSPEQPIIWSFGGQGNAVRWIAGKGYYADDVTGSGWNADLKRRKTELASIYFNHSNLTTEQKQAVVDIFTEYGFISNYDMSEHRSIEIDLQATQEAIDFAANANALVNDTAVMC